MFCIRTMCISGIGKTLLNTMTILFKKTAHTGLKQKNKNKNKLMSMELGT